MEIKPMYVTFEQAKWLKEKGFTEKVHQYYQFIRNKSSKLNETWQFLQSSFLVRESDAAMFPDEGVNGVVVSAYSDRIFRDYNFKNSEDFISAPEQWQVVEWALQVHKIFISVMPYDTINSAKEWTVSLFDLEFGEDKEIHYLTKIGGCNSYHEAISKGIDEFLKRI